MMSCRTPGLVGTGYGDGGFSQACLHCNRELCKESMAIGKFVKDAKLLLTKDFTMPGTVLNPMTGRVTRIPHDSRASRFPRTFPNRLIRFDLRIKLVDLMNPAGSEPSPTMETVRKMIEDIIIDDKRLRSIESASIQSGRYGNYRIQPLAKMSTRKMMSRYWENFSPFALDLCGAVMRQGVFIEKMNDLDWLHSPSVGDTMQRLIIKYTRFIELMSSNAGKVVVPTLDVDLAWHTHQLSPRAYYKYVCKKTSQFTDHDDKIDEDKLNKQFEWTTKIYQDTYGEVYSECTCWYCESEFPGVSPINTTPLLTGGSTAIRSSQVSSVGKFLKLSSSEKATDEFYKSGRAKLCPPNNSAHISSHNAVRFRESEAGKRVTAAIRSRQQEKLEREYEKAVKRAEKKGRTLPPRDDYYSHWGYAYFSMMPPLHWTSFAQRFTDKHGKVYGPFMYPAYMGGAMYAGWDPCGVTAGHGQWANCAAGTCSAHGGVAAGACGGSGVQTVCTSCVKKHGHIANVVAMLIVRWLRWWV